MWGSAAVVHSSIQEMSTRHVAALAALVMLVPASALATAPSNLVATGRTDTKLYVQ
jgi:hypothetical protein